MKPYRDQIFSMGQVFVKGSLRSHLFSGLMAGGILLFSAIYLLGFLVTGARGHTLQTGGFWALGLWGVVSATALGINLIDQEIKLKTHYMVLSRPVNRTRFVLGKYVGMFTVTTLLFCGMAAAGWLLIVLGPVELTMNHGIALGFIFVEWLVLAGFSLFFACFTTPVLHCVFMVGLYYLGHWSNAIRLFADRMDGAGLKQALLTLYYLFPNLEVFNFRGAALYATPVDPSDLIYAASLGAGWSLVMLGLSMMIFHRRRIL